MIDREVSDQEEMDEGGNEEDGFYDQSEDYISPPYSEDGEVAYQRLIGEDHNEERGQEVSAEGCDYNPFDDYWFQGETGCLDIEEVEEAYWALMAERYYDEESVDSPCARSKETEEEVHTAEDEV